MKKVALKYLVLIGILSIGLIMQSQTDGKVQQTQIPRNLNEALMYLNRVLSTKEKNTFKNKSENDATADLFYSTGLWMRNTWLRGNRAPDLIKYFNSIGIYNPEDMSAIILVSFHRQLNNKPLAVENQVKPYLAYWKSISECDAKANQIAKVNFHKFKTGEPIVILMYVDTVQNERNAVTFECPNTDWRFDPKKDLLINGTIIKKDFRNGENILFTIRINKMNYPNTTIFMDTIKIGSQKDFSLKHLTIKPFRKT